MKNEKQKNETNNLYSFRRPNRRSTPTLFTKPSKTKQSFREECDINNILKKFAATGQINHLRDNPQYADFSTVEDYQHALSTVLLAQDQFAGLSAQVRDRFANDPNKFLQFMSDPQNATEMVKLGLAKKREGFAPMSSDNSKRSQAAPSNQDKGNASREPKHRPKGDSQAFNEDAE